MRAARVPVQVARVLEQVVRAPVQVARVLVQAVRAPVQEVRVRVRPLVRQWERVQVPGQRDPERRHRHSRLHPRRKHSTQP